MPRPTTVDWRLLKDSLMRQAIVLIALLAVVRLPVLWCSAGFPYSILAQNGIPSTASNKKKYLFDVQPLPAVHSLRNGIAELEQPVATDAIANSGNGRSRKNTHTQSVGANEKGNGLQSGAGASTNVEKRPRNIFLRLLGMFLRIPNGTKVNDIRTNSDAEKGDGNGKNRAMKRKAFDVSYRQHISDTGKNAYHPLIMKGFERFQIITAWTAAFVEANKSQFKLVGKAAIFATVGVVVARRVVNWYRGISDFEVLLDQRDVQYHTYGGVLRQAAVTVLSSVNHTTAAELKYDALYDKIVSALDKPCHPQLTQGYCVHTGRTTAVLLSEIDNRIRSYRRRVSRHKASHPGREVQGLPTLQSAVEEGQVLLSLQRGIALLQARQADAYLRVTRSHLLTAANTLEDLLAQTRRRHGGRARSALNSRLTMLRAPRSVGVGGTQRVKLTEADKCDAIEHMLRWYYTQAATVQRHLDGLAGIEVQLDALPVASGSTVSAGQENNDSHREHGTAAWEALEGWVSAASALATQSATTTRSGIEVDAPPPPSAPSPSSPAASTSSTSASPRRVSTGPSAGTSSSPDLPVVPPESAAAISGATSRSSEDALSSKVVDFAHSVLDKLTSSVLGEASAQPADRTVVIAQLALLVVHLLGTAHDNETPEELVCEFTLHGDVRSVVTSCVVDSRPMLAALERGGHEVTQVNGWEPVHRNNISFAHYLSQLDSGVLNTTMLNSLWYRELRYRSLRYTLLLERDPSEHLLLQVLNTAGKVVAPNAEFVSDSAVEANDPELVATSAVLLALCVDLPAHELRTEGANCTMKWVFSPVSPAHVLSTATNAENGTDTTVSDETREARVANIGADDIASASKMTRVRVTLSQSKPQGVYQLLARHFVGRHVRAFVDSWRTAAQAKIETSGRSAHLPPLEDQLHNPVEQALLHSLDAVTAPQGPDKRLPPGRRPLGAVKLRSSRYEYEVSYATQAATSPGELLRLADDDGTVYLHDLRDESLRPAATGDGGAGKPATSKAAYVELNPDDRIVSDAVMAQLNMRSEQVQQCFQRQRSQWRASGVILQDLQKAPAAFSDHLVSVGLQRKSQRGVLSLIRPRIILRLVFWSAVAAGGLGLTKKSSQLSFRAEAVARHINSFVERRVVRPLTNILNDVVLNKRVSITDQTALKDAKRSLSAMIHDFLLQHGKTLSESERKRIATTMDMRPISEEYELELRRPMQSIVSGKIARLVLIQLQFVKKELLVAMQAIDDLFNANQVNLQLLAITPAVLSIVSLNIVSKTLIAAFRATSRGKKVESSAAINRELREGIRAIERVLFIFHDPQSGKFNNSAREEMSLEDSGRVLSSLHKMQGILVMNNNFFDSTVLRQLQDDLRDLALPEISVTQRVALVERIYRVFPSTQPSRNIWGNAFNQ